VTNLYTDLSDAPPPLAVPARALTVGAHPDDAEFGAGATLARWADGGCEVTVVVVTDGSKGSWDPDEDQARLTNRRKDEQHAAARVLGVSDVIFLGETDGELVDTPELRTAIADLIRQVQPEVVLTHDPWQRYQMHPDHRATGRAAVDAVVAAREPLAKSPTGLKHHRPDAILLWSADEPDHVEPVDESAFQSKVGALMCHSSQSVTTMGDAASSPELRSDFEHKLREWMTIGDNGDLAEQFKRLTP